MSDDQPVKMRVQARQELAKGLKDFDALRRTDMLKYAFTMAGLKDGSFHFLAQGMSVADVGPLLLLAAGVCENIEKQNSEFKLDLPARLPLEPPSVPTGRKREPEVKRHPDGELEAPEGEAFTSCAECGSSRWLSTTRNDDHMPGRLVCARCGNEIKFIRIRHAEGHA